MKMPPWKVRCPVCHEYFQPRHAAQWRCTDSECRKKSAAVEDVLEFGLERKRIEALLGED